jgi:DNA-binding SARP family transcriptional activator
VLEFHILGPVEVIDEGRVLAAGGQKQRALLAALLINAGHVVSTDHLLEMLWGERPPRTAITSLQNSVSHLRKLLGPDVLLTRPPGYQLEVAPGALDLDRFTVLVEEARPHDAGERARRLREALSLWRGRPLADFEYEAFARQEILRLEELRLEVLEERIAADLEAGRDTELVGELQSLVAEHPSRERLCGQLMLALYRSGRKAEATRAFHEFRSVLVDEVGLEPSPALRRLHGGILRDARELEPGRAESPSEDHYEEVRAALLSGRVVPVLGADVADLSERLAEYFQYPRQGEPELTRICQYVAVMRGSGPLYDELHALLDADEQPTPVHRFLAALPTLLRERGAEHQLIVTTGYDLALERAFLEAGEEFDVVSYLATGRNRGRFCHIAPDGAGTLIKVPNTYAAELSLARRTVILKLHGQVDRRPEREWESFVITEDDYIDYLARADLANVVPVGLAAKLRRSHLLFLGYTMRDWNLRVILSRLWEDDSLTYRSWSVRPDVEPLEREFWRRRGVDVLQLPLEEYVNGLAGRAGLEIRAAPA